MLQRHREDTSRAAGGAASAAYRPDIDGLRAIAVLAVVFCHAGVPHLTGGFVGVDIFFVISGFLITRIIAGELETGSFSLLTFYERRARRILPALFFMLSLTAVAAALIMIPDDLKTFGESLAATLLFASNFYFNNELNYFSGPAMDYPLLHTWSLGIEEQFYILWPLLLAGLFATRWRSRAGLIAVGLLTVSFVCSQVMVGTSPKAAFYLLPSRAFELMAGAVLALRILPPVRNKALNNLLSLAGLALIAAAMILYDDDMAFPGAAALVPCLGAALLIYSGAGGNALGSRILSLRPLVFTGLISYSLYLWHWPLLSLASLGLNRGLLVWETVALLAAGFVLATVSWRYIERPFRGRHATSSRPRLHLYLASATAALIMAAALASIYTNGFPQRANAAVIAAQELAASNAVGKCRAVRPQGAEDKACPIGITQDAHGAHKIVLWGDSHAAHYLPAVDHVAKREGRPGLAFWRSACSPLIGVDKIKTTKNDAACKAWNQRVLEFIQSQPDINLVILAGRWSVYSGAPDWVSRRRIFLTDAKSGELSEQNTRRAFEDALKRTIAALQSAGKQVVLLQQVPQFRSFVPQCIARDAMHGRLSSRCKTVARADVDHQLGYTRAVLEKLAAQMPGVSVFSPLPHLCGEEQCFSVLDDRILYIDDDHLSREGALFLAAFLQFR